MIRVWFTSFKTVIRVFRLQALEGQTLIQLPGKTRKLRANLVSRRAGNVWIEPIPSILHFHRSKMKLNCLEQVRTVTRKICEPLEEDSFRPILHHYDGPKFRLELNIPEVIAEQTKP